MFDCVNSFPKNVSEIAKQLNLDYSLSYSLSYRLLRALGSLGLLREDLNRNFSITAQGELLGKDHPQTQRNSVVGGVEEHYSLWKHLPSMIMDGKQNAFLHEYGKKLFEYTDGNPPHREVFNEAISSYSCIQTVWISEAFEGYDFSKTKHVSDVGGGQGHLLCSLLVKYPPPQRYRIRVGHSN